MNIEKHSIWIVVIMLILLLLGIPAGFFWVMSSSHVTYSFHIGVSHNEEDIPGVASDTLDHSLPMPVKAPKKKI